MASTIDFGSRQLTKPSLSQIGDRPETPYPDLGKSLKKPLLTYCVLPQKLEQVRRICHSEDLAVVGGVRGIVEPRLGGTTTQLFPQVAVVLCKVGDRSILFIIILLS